MSLTRWAIAAFTTGVRRWWLAACYACLRQMARFDAVPSAAYQLVNKLAHFPRGQGYEIHRQVSHSVADVDIIPHHCVMHDVS